MEYKTISDYIQNKFKEHIEANIGNVADVEYYNYLNGLMNGIWVTCMDNITVYKICTWEQALNQYNSTSCKLLSSHITKLIPSYQYVPFLVDTNNINFVVNE